MVYNIIKRNRDFAFTNIKFNSKYKSTIILKLTWLKPMLINQ